MTLARPEDIALKKGQSKQLKNNLFFGVKTIPIWYIFKLESNRKFVLKEGLAFRSIKVYFLSHLEIKYYS